MPVLRGRSTGPHCRGGGRGRRAHIGHPSRRFIHASVAALAGRDSGSLGGRSAREAGSESVPGRGGPPAAPNRRAASVATARTQVQTSAKVMPKPTVNKTPEQRTSASWEKARSGLGWVLFGLFWLSIPGFVGFGKLMYSRQVGELPGGEGWVKIPGYVNDNAPNAIHMSKTEQLDVALYALPVVLGGLCLSFGRLTAGAAPRASGASGLFAGSGLFTLLGLASLVTAAACDKLLFKTEFGYTAVGFLIFAGLAEFWFLIGLTACGVGLNHPSVSRAVGLVGFLFALAAILPTLGWTAYIDPRWKLRPSPLPDQWRLYEQAALMLGWLILIGADSRGSARGATRNSRVPGLEPGLKGLIPPV